MITTSPPLVSVQRPANQHDLLSARAGRVRFLDVPPARYFVVDGTGAPGGDEFKEAFGALYPVAYTVHFALRKRGVAAPVGALEGLFWRSGGGPITAADSPAPGDAPDAVDWRVMHWQLMLPVPEAALEEEIVAAIDEVGRKKAPPALPRLHVDRLEEGPSAQILHVGPYDAEPPTIAALHAAIGASGLRPTGRHHEIYLSDPGRTPADRIKTIIRQPVEGLSK
jgi:hypothetical protein